VRNFREAECDKDHYLVIEKVREILAGGKQATQSLDRHRFNVSKLIELEVWKEYQVEITNRFASLESLKEDEDLNRIRGNINYNIQISRKESLGMHDWKQDKHWFDEECLGFWIKGSGQKCNGKLSMPK